MEVTILFIIMLPVMLAFILKFTEKDRLKRLQKFVKSLQPSSKALMPQSDDYEAEAMAELDEELGLSDREHDEAIAEFSAQLGVEDADAQEMRNPEVLEKEYIQAWLKVIETKTYDGEIEWEDLGTPYLRHRELTVTNKYNHEPKDVYVAWAVETPAGPFEIAFMRYRGFRGSLEYQLYVNGADMEVRRTLYEYKHTKRIFDMIRRQSENKVVPKKILEVTKTLEEV